MNTMGTTDSFGIGVDIESIDRFAGLERTQDSSFLNKIFTLKELEYCYSKKIPAPHLAARFAGKEAIIKALCNMDRPKSNYRDIEIVNEKSGVPEVRIEKPGFHDLQIKLSLSHCNDKAIAFAVVTETK
ncbi:MAG TPA: holo-ACP synthase [Dehalococcoidales bacterium]|nr:holo-ACP synthase [Dehalococcoidales bacterium]